MTHNTHNTHATQGVFLLGIILQRLEPLLRDKAGAGAWQVR